MVKCAAMAYLLALICIVINLCLSSATACPDIQVENGEVVRNGKWDVARLVVLYIQTTTSRG